MWVPVCFFLRICASLSIFCQFLTYLHDPSKNRGVVHSAAVPAPMSELVLALSDARLGALADVLHVVLVELAQLLLALGQAHQLAAQRLGTDDVGLGDQQRVHGQRPERVRHTQRSCFHSCAIMFKKCTQESGPNSQTTADFT